MASSKRDIVALEYLRLFAAIMLILYHAANGIKGLKQYYLEELSFIAVDVFFCISGFIMFYVIFKEKPESLSFLRRRLLRVVPLYWIALTITVVMNIALSAKIGIYRINFETTILSYAFIPHYSLVIKEKILPILIVGWTLNVEIFFYILLAVSLAIRRNNPFPVYCAISVLLGGIGVFLYPSPVPALTVITSPWHLEFAAGAFFAWLMVRRGWRPSVGTATLLIGGGVALTVAAFWDGEIVMLRILAAALILAGCLCPRIADLPLRFLLPLGAATYSIYLSHLFTIGFAKAPLLVITGPINTWSSALSAMALIVAACLAVGWLVHRCVEIPLVHLLRRWA